MVNLDVLKGLPRPIEWKIGDLELNEDLVEVPVTYVVHDGGTDSAGRRGKTLFQFNKDGLVSVLKRIEKLNHFELINELGKLAIRRDEEYYQLLVMIDKARYMSTRQSKKENYAELENLLLKSPRFNKRLERICFLETIMNVFSTPKELNTKEVQELLS